jgi:superfamily II DNA or RNA helicase
MMDREELDVIVTVDKVGVGFDYPPLCVGVFFSPIISPAKCIQNTGRIMRMTDRKKPQNIVDEAGKLVPSPCAYIIAPEGWHGRVVVKKNFESREGETSEDEKMNKKYKATTGIHNFLEFMIAQ